jgi:uncharacterized circularly permuted ATP-grasp superfamily protein/uncharacterized alpha-E superfamily protein
VNELRVGVEAEVHVNVASRISMSFFTTTGSNSAPGFSTADYRPAADGFDEMRAPLGFVRPHWVPLMQRIEALGFGTLNERRENVLQLLREHGVTYNAYADGQRAARTWELDVLPLLIGAPEWAALEAGLVQRTRLLNLVLSDIYGAQKLFSDGLLPPALLHANPGFLRQCHGVRPAGDRWLTLHAVDLTRAANGQWWVLSDRTQAPSGIGYTLENRVILSRVLAEEFRAANVQRVASFFARRKDGLRASAPWSTSPNIVLLTPGPFAATYFEHVYLARYLGYPLVEGSDLTVRDRRVFIRTIEGLQPVDVIVRRVDDTFCDPLELRGDSFLGVPGLLEAARAGNVSISNALGSGAVESSALLAFLPALAARLLGEDLRLPNVATWWCGQAREREYALKNLHRLVIKPAFVGLSGEPAFGEALDSTQRAALADRIRAFPANYLAQERVPLSTAPVWTGNRLEPRPLTLRCYICATPDGYAVLPGGLTRVSAATDSPVVSSQFGGGSKDTWILAEGPVDDMSFLDPRGVPVAQVHRSVSVASRVVENIFWLGRYIERLEDTTRLLRVTLGRLAGEGSPMEQAELAIIIECLVALDRLPEKCKGHIPLEELSAALCTLLYDREHFGSVRDLLDRVGGLTSSVRDRFSADTWRILNHLQTEFPTAAPARLDAGAAVGVLHRVIFHLAAFSGMEMENMTRGHAWRFLDIGRRIERSANLASTIRAAMSFPDAVPIVLMPLLEYSDSTMTYRRRHLTRPELPEVLKLLLAEVTNPRSLAFQVETLRKHFTSLPGLDSSKAGAPLLDELHALLANTDFSLACQLLGRFISACFNLSDSLSQRYFSHVAARRT